MSNHNLDWAAGVAPYLTGEDLFALAQSSKEAANQTNFERECAVADWYDDRQVKYVGDTERQQSAIAHEQLRRTIWGRLALEQSRSRGGVTLSDTINYEIACTTTRNLRIAEQIRLQPRRQQLRWFAR